jgi:hypothetical protein
MFKPVQVILTCTTKGIGPYVVLCKKQNGTFGLINVKGRATKTEDIQASVTVIKNTTQQVVQLNSSDVTHHMLDNKCTDPFYSVATDIDVKEFEYFFSANAQLFKNVPKEICFVQLGIFNSDLDTKKKDPLKIKNSQSEEIKISKNIVGIVKQYNAHCMITQDIIKMKKTPIEVKKLNIFAFVAIKSQKKK